MTALRKYLRLESPGLWREAPDARLREVIVGLRDATLVLTDPRTEAALSQWSLPAIARLNPGKMPAIFGVGAEMAETLEIDDPDMTAALETVQSAIERRRPRRGRLRGIVTAGVLAVLAGLAVFWLPDRILRYTATMLPAPTRAELGQDALADLTRLTGSPCAGKPGMAALAALEDRLDSTGAPLRIVIVREALAQPLHLPGGIVVLPDAVLQAAASPDVIAGHLLAERQRAVAEDPVLAVLRHAGLLPTLHLLTQGSIDPEAVSGYGQTLLTQAPAAVADEPLLALFAAAGISSAAYAFALDASGETTLGLIEADPSRNGSAPAVLDADAWQDLKAICKG